jgi:hypothetical protein
LDNLVNTVPLHAAELQNINAILQQYKVDLDRTMDQVNRQSSGMPQTSSGSHGGRQMSLLEMKSITNLATMDSDRQKY